MKHSGFHRAIVAIAMMLIVGFSANAHDFESGGIYYNITSSVEPYTVEVTYRGNYYSSYSNEYSGIVVIPESITYRGVEYSVTSIGRSAFEDCSGLTSVTIGNSVTSIGGDAFYGCSGLTSVVWNAIKCNDFAYYSNSPFYNCSNITSFTFGDAVQHIPAYLCYYMSKLTSIEIPNSVTSIGDGAFYYCSVLTSVVWNAINCTYSSGSSPFSDSAANITSFTFGDAVQHIPAYLCYYMSELSSIEIPNSVTSIGEWAFSDCSDLTSIEIPNSVTSIGGYAFRYCSDLTSIEIPNSVTSIGEWAFSYCSRLTSIEIPNSVTSIGGYAFSYCSRLTSIEIPNSVTSIGGGAFYRCSGLTSVVWNAINCTDSSGSSPFSDSAANITSFTFGDSVEHIPAYLCSHMSKLTSIEIPNSVTSIGEYAFYLCSGLTSIEIPNSVTSIGNSAFCRCDGLTSIEIPNSVTSIGNSAFRYCDGLTSIEIPNSVTSIGGDAFGWCSGLTSVTIGNSVTSIGDYAFEGCSGLTIVYINDLEAYCNIEFANYNANPVYYAKNLYLNGSLIEDLVIPEGVAKISDYSFRGLNHIKTVTIPNSVTSIGYRAFYGCSGLTSIEIPNSVTSIGGDAFGWCSGLTSVTIGNSVTSIGDYAFESCSGLTSIEIPNSVTSIGDYAFESCSGLTSIEIPNSVTSIGDYAFSDCSGLTSVEIGNSVTSIGNYAFYSCESLTSIEIGNSVTSIGKFAFEGCENLTSVVWNVKKCSDFSFSSRPFKNCPNITSFTFGDEVEHIPAYLCYNLSKLTSIQIPNSVTSIGGTAFEGCKSLTSIVIGNSVTSIRDHAFAYCSSLTKITCMATTPPTIESYTFSNYSAKLHVPSGCKSAYKSAIYWKNFNIKEIPTLSTSIALNKTSASLKATETLTLIATVLPENATNKSVTWKSSNEAVATVDANGKVTAVAVGEATITATTADGSNLSASCKVTVTSTLATSITLDYTEYEIVEKSDFQLTATILPESTTNKGVVWSSSDMRIASVDENGLVRAYSVGEAVITATTIDGSNLSASCKVTVVSSLAQSITLDKTEVSLKATETTTLVATVLPETTSNKSVEWKSSNEAVATVNNKGEVTAIAVGEATITATTADGSNLFASCTVTVVPTLAESIALDKTEISLEATETATLVTTVLPELATNKSVTWKSSDETVAEVDANGLVTAIAVGEATITATTTDGSNLSASCKVTVVPTLTESITLDKTEISLEATETATLVATVLPELTTDKSVEWSSSDESVAVVDENGVVTAIAVGEATITATTVDGSNLSASCKIIVKPTLATSITLDYSEYEIAEKSDFQLVATVLPELATDKGVVWSSSDKWVASVNENGLVTAYSVGEATITATTTDGSDLSASCKVTVVPTLAETITLDKTEISLEATETATLLVTVLPELTTDKSVEWSSSDESVATIDANGLVTAIAVGEAIITATTTDGSNLTVSCKVTVVPTLAETITLDKTEISLEAKETATLLVTVLPELATDKSVKWSSSDETVAVVDENGVVTAIAVGEAIITATTADGSNLSASCKVSVIPTLAVSIELDQTEASVEEKSDLQLTANILPEHATNKEVAWSSSDKWVASVDNTGLVTMYSAGEVVITATTTDGTNLSATCRINVYSGIDGVEGDDLIVATIGDNIVVKNAKIDSIVRVYAADSNIISSEVATDGDVVVEAPIKGVYIVSVNGKTFKVMVK